MMTPDEEKTSVRVAEDFRIGKESDLDNAFHYIQDINTADLDTGRSTSKHFDGRWIIESCQ